MPLTTRQCIAGPLRGVLSLLGAAVLAVVFCGSAEASCGDYLHVGRPIEMHTAMAQEASRSGDQVPASAPCQGPRCERGPADPPVQPPPVSRSFGPDDQAIRLTEKNSTGTDFAGPFSNPDESALDGYPRSLKRPPRASTTTI